MTLYDKIRSYSIDTMAYHIYGIIAGTEERMLGNLSALGLDISLATASEDVRIAQVKADLMKEIDDGDT